MKKKKLLSPSKMVQFAKLVGTYEHPFYYRSIANALVKLGIQKHPSATDKSFVSKHYDKIVEHLKSHGLVHQLYQPKYTKTPKTKKVSSKPKDYGFYSTRPWLELRYAVLKKYGAKCMCCGATRADGVQIHVDHIKPRVKFPELELDINNLQVLCSECNIGKSYKDDSDWRTHLDEIKKAP
jgi:5-methylcytosine-specific restriction endonuclease McrA